MSTVATSLPKKNDLRMRIGPLSIFIQRFFLATGALLAFLLFWEIAPGQGWIDPYIFPTPTQILAEMVKLTLSGLLITNTAISMERISFGLGLAIMVAIPLGFLLGGWFRSFETAMNPLLLVLSQANPFTLLPVFMTILGIGELSRISIIFWVCQWPILFATVAGIRNADASLVKMARSLGMSRSQVFIKVLLPGAVPDVFTGLRISVVFGFFMLIGAEMLGANSGLGYMIITSCPFHQASFQLEKMWAGIVTVAIIGILMNWTILRIEKQFTQWKEETEI